MAKTSLLELAKAIKLAVDGEATITTKGVLYNAPPDGTSSPYYLLTELEEENKDTFERTGKRCFFEIHAVTSHRGDQESLEMLEPVVAFLDRKALTIVDWSHGFKIRHINTAPSVVLTGNEFRRSVAARFETFLQDSS